MRLIDLGPHLYRPVFELLKEPVSFKTSKVNADIETVTWPNDADFSPDFLYEIGEVISEQQDVVADR